MVLRNHTSKIVGHHCLDSGGDGIEKPYSKIVGHHCLNSEGDGIEKPYK
jgi:hypothetical protein